MNLAWKEKILIMMKIKNEECDKNDIQAEKQLLNKTGLSSTKSK